MERDAYFRDNFSKEVDVELVLLVFLPGAVVIRSRFVRGSLISKMAICNSPPGLGLERDL